MERGFMSTADNPLLKSIVQNIFEKEQETKEREKAFADASESGIDRSQLELALTVLLVDLASCDQDFDPKEYQVISSGLRRIFGTSKTEISGLVNQANLQLANLRGVSKFTELLRENLSLDERKAIMEVIEDVISADGQEEDFEVYLRTKLSDLLGINEVAGAEPVAANGSS